MHKHVQTAGCRISRQRFSARSPPMTCRMVRVIFKLMGVAFRLALQMGGLLIDHGEATAAHWSERTAAAAAEDCGSDRPCSSSLNKIITTMVIRPLDDPSMGSRTSVLRETLQPLSLLYWNLPEMAHHVTTKRIAKKWQSKY